MPDASPISPGTRCHRHAMILASHVCGRCGQAVCDRCILQENGQIVCPACASEDHTPFMPPPTGVSLSPTRTVVDPSIERPRTFIVPPHPYAEFKCVNHPESEAAARCAGCGSHVCPVCDFRLGGGRHACPACVLSEPGTIPSSRRNLAIIGCLIAAWATVGMGLLLSGYFASMIEDPSDMYQLDLALHFLVFLPNLGGFACSMSAIERNQPNSSFLWVAVIWNAVLALGYVALTIIGNFFM